jgi:hypothetical protein
VAITSIFGGLPLYSAAQPIMSSRKKKPAVPASSSVPPEPAARGAQATSVRVPRRLWVFAALDVLFAALYIGVTRLAASADGRFEALTVVMGVAMLVAGVGIAVRRPWGWWASLAGCAVVLLGALTLTVLLAMSVGFLWAAFGSLGKGAASMCLIMIALVVECYVLLPAFQVAWLWSPAGRRVAGVPERAGAASEARA